MKLSTNASRAAHRGLHSSVFQFDLPLGKRLDPFARRHDDSDRLTLAQ